MGLLVTARTYNYQPKLVDKIVVREFAFEFPQDLDPVWRLDNPVIAHLFNGLSLVKPYLEPHLAKSMLRAISHIDVPELIEDMRDFSAQESRHYESATQRDIEVQWLSGTRACRTTHGAIVQAIDEEEPAYPVGVQRRF